MYKAFLTSLVERVPDTECAVDVVSCRACWKLSSLGGGTDTSLLSKPQPHCVSVYLSLSVCLWGNWGPLLTHLSRSHTHTDTHAATFFLFLYITLVLYIPPSILVPFFPLSQGYSRPEQPLSHQESSSVTAWWASHRLRPAGPDHRLQVTTHMNTHANTHKSHWERGKQNCWLYFLFCHQITSVNEMKISLSHVCVLKAELEYTYCYYRLA